MNLNLFSVSYYLETDKYGCVQGGLSLPMNEPLQACLYKIGDVVMVKRGVGWPPLREDTLGIVLEYSIQLCRVMVGDMKIHCHQTRIYHVY